MINNIIFDYQFFISANNLKKVPDIYSCYDFPGRRIFYDKRYSCLEVKNKDSVICAVIIGFIHIANNPYFLSCKSNEDIVINSINEIEHQLLPVLSGSFILLTFGCLESRLYLDHGGSIPAVYDKETGNISTTTSMILDEESYKKRFIDSIHNELISKEKIGGWISGTLTAHHSIFRLLPNFFLDLDKLEQHRYWPRKDETTWIGFEEAITIINSSLKGFTTAAINSFNVSHTLTAGYDSRLLLSACRNIVEQCSFFTIVPCSSVDNFMSQKIAKQFNLNYEQIQLIHSEYNDQKIWDKMVGNCVNEINREMFKTLQQLDRVNFIVTGMYGEIGRCRLYRQDYRSINDLPLNIDIIMSRLTLPKNNELTENISSWFATLTGHHNSVILDLAFHELKFGSWAMGQHPIQNFLKFNLLPFAQRPIISSFLRVRPEEKTTKELFNECIKSAWPELIDIPVNNAGLIINIQDNIKKIFSKNRIKRYLRDRFAWYL